MASPILWAVLSTGCATGIHGAIERGDQEEVLARIQTDWDERTRVRTRAGTTVEVDPVGHILVAPGLSLEARKTVSNELLERTPALWTTYHNFLLIAYSPPEMVDWVFRVSRLHPDSVKAQDPVTGAHFRPLSVAARAYVINRDPAAFRTFVGLLDRGADAHWAGMTRVIASMLHDHPGRETESNVIASELYRRGLIQAYQVQRAYEELRDIRRLERAERARVVAANARQKREQRERENPSWMETFTRNVPVYATGLRGGQGEWFRANANMTEHQRSVVSCASGLEAACRIAYPHLYSGKCPNGEACLTAIEREEYDAPTPPRGSTSRPAETYTPPAPTTDCNGNPVGTPKSPGSTCPN